MLASNVLALRRVLVVIALCPVLATCGSDHAPSGLGSASMPAGAASSTERDDETTTADFTVAARPRAAGRAARRAYEAAVVALDRDDATEAIRLAELSVAKGGRGHFLLARGHARLGEIDAAFEWLQRAATDEGIDPFRLARERDLSAMRTDARWTDVVLEVRTANAHWHERAAPAPAVAAPHDASEHAVALLVGLHESGGDAAHFVDPSVYAARAERLGVAFAGVSGGERLGPMAYAWSTDPHENARRIAEAIAAVKRRVWVDDKHVILFGFAEGAQVAVDTAAADPSRYCGAIALSPSGLGWHLEELTPGAGLAHQGYVVAFGHFETVENVALSYIDARLLRGLGARVQVRGSWSYGQHMPPPDFNARLGFWTRFILQTKP